MENSTYAAGGKPFAQILFVLGKSFDDDLLREAFSGLLAIYSALRAYGRCEITEGDARLTEARLSTSGNIVSQNTLFIADIIRSEEKMWIIFSLSAHLSDAWSLEVLLRQFLAGLSSESLVAEEISYSQFSQWREEITKLVTPEEVEFWERRRVEGRMNFRFYTLPQRMAATCCPKTKAWVLGAEKVRRLRDSYPGAEEAVLASCWLTVLSRHNDNETPVMGYVGNGRLYPDLKNLVGVVNRTMPLTGGMPGGARLNENIRQMEEEIENLNAHHYSFPEDKDIEGSGFQVAYEYIGYPGDWSEGGEIGLLIGGKEYHSIKLCAVDRGETILLQLSYADVCYSENSAAEIGRQLIAVVDAAISDPSLPWEETPMEDFGSVDRGKRQPMFGGAIESFTQTLEKVCREFPQKAAATFNEKILTYSHLWAESDRLAEILTAEYDVEPGDCIAVVTEDVVSMICMLAAIIKTGALYVAPNPDDPAVPTNGLPIRKQGKLSSDAVADRHRCLIEYVRRVRDDYNLSGLDTASLLFGAVGNVRYAGIWETLLTGGTLHILPGYLAAMPEVIAEYLVNKKVTCLIAAPLFFSSLLRGAQSSMEKLLARVGHLFFHDGRISADELSVIWSMNDRMRIVNFYSPGGMAFPVLAHESEKEKLNYYRDHWVAGRVFSCCPVEVLDDSSRACARGIAGNICVGEDKVVTGFRGYWNISYELEWIVEAGGDEKVGGDEPSAEDQHKTMEIVREVWEDIFRRKGISDEDNFFQLGGDSIKAMLIGGRLQTKGYHIDIRDIFLYPTIMALARAIKPALSGEMREDVEAEFPMPPIYHHFFETITFAPHHHNQSVLLSLPDTDPEVLRQALEKIIDAHSVLRLTMRRTIEGEWTPVIGPRGMRPEIGVSAIEPGPKGLKEINKIMNESQGRFDLFSGPLYQFHYFKTGSECFLFIVLHHLVTDIVSWNILIEDLDLLLKLSREGSALLLPAPGGSFGHCANYLNDYAQSIAVSAQYEFWSGVPTEVVFPKDRPDGTNYVRNLRSCSFGLDEDATGKLLGLAGDLGRNGMEALLLTALRRGLRQMLGVEEVLVMMESHGRQLPGAGTSIQRTMGWFTALYPFFIGAVGTDEESDDICRRLQEIPAGGIGYGLLRYMGKERKEGLGHRPNILFNYLGNHEGDTSTGRLVKMVERQTGIPEDKNEKRAYEFEVVSAVQRGVFRLNLYYSGEQFQGQKMDDGIVAIRDELLNLTQRKDWSGLATAGLAAGPITKEDFESFFD